MRWRVVAAVVGVCVVVSGCGESGEEGSSYTGTDVGMESPVVTAWEAPEVDEVFGEVDQGDVDSVAESFVSVFFGFRPGEDEWPGAAPVRAEGLMTGELAEGYRDSWSSMVGVSGPMWERWVSGGGSVVMEVSPGVERRPPATEVSDYRQCEVRVRVVDGSGVVMDELVYVVFMELRNRGWWRVSRVQIDGPVGVVLR